MVQHAPQSGTGAETAVAPQLSPLAISLLKGVVYRENDERLWSALLQLQARVRDYMAVLDLELVLDEAEGYAFLQSRPEPDGDAAPARVPRLIARRPLAFPVSLLLALLRKRLAEFDAGGGETRLVLNLETIAELVRVYLPDASNEARLLDQIEGHVNKVVELGFLKRLKPPRGAAAAPDLFEVQRILKAFVDAQWLSEFDARLAGYLAHLASGTPGGGSGDE